MFSWKNWPLPPEMEIEFVIELQLGTTLTSRVPYRMALAELKGLNIQLQELLERMFTQPNVSLWGKPLCYS